MPSLTPPAPPNSHHTHGYDDKITILALLRGKLLRGQRSAILEYFRCRDVDKNGTLDLHEFRTMLQSLSVHASEKGSADLFEFIAGDADSLTLRALLRKVWGNGKASSLHAELIELPTIAIGRGVKIAHTQQVERAANATFSEHNLYNNVGQDRFEFVGTSKTKNVPFYLQGTHKWDSPAMVERRIALLHSPAVVRACRQFWDTLGLADDAQVSFDQYRKVHRLVTRALAPEMRETEWEEACREEWRVDLARAKVLQRHSDAPVLGLGFEAYVFSFFEIADLWTDSVHETAYIIFINKLWRRVTKPSALKGAKLLPNDRLAGCFISDSERATSVSEVEAQGLCRSFRSVDQVVPFEPREMDDAILQANDALNADSSSLEEASSGSNASVESSLATGTENKPSAPEELAELSSQADRGLDDLQPGRRACAPEGAELNLPPTAWRATEESQKSASEASQCLNGSKPKRVVSERTHESPPASFRQHRKDSMEISDINLLQQAGLPEPRQRKAVKNFLSPLKPVQRQPTLRRISTQSWTSTDPPSVLRTPADLPGSLPVTKPRLLPSLPSATKRHVHSSEVEDFLPNRASAASLLLSRPSSAPESPNRRTKGM